MTEELKIKLLKEVASVLKKALPVEIMGMKVTFELAKNWPQLWVDVEHKEFSARKLYVDISSERWGSNEKTGWIKFDCHDLWEGPKNSVRTYKIKDGEISPSLKEKILDVAKRWVNHTEFEFDQYEYTEKASRENLKNKKSIVNKINQINKRRFDVSYDESVFRISPKSWHRNTYITVDLDEETIEIELDPVKITPKKLNALLTLLEK